MDAEVLQKAIIRECGQLAAPHGDLRKEKSWRALSLESGPIAFLSTIPIPERPGQGRVRGIVDCRAAGLMWAEGGRAYEKDIGCHSSPIDV
jgi:hypothetical protein